MKAELLMGVGSFVMLVRTFIGQSDEKRIKSYIEERGGNIKSLAWTPFHKIWERKSSDRLYTAEYEDNKKNLHQIFLKTSVINGVKTMDDQIIDYSETLTSHIPVEKEINDIQNYHIELLKWENELLKKEIKKLKGEKKS